MAKTPNQIVNEAYKALQKLSKDSGGFADNYDYKKEVEIKTSLEKEANVTGFTEILSKDCIFKFISIQRRLRIWQPHTFYGLFSNEKY